MYVCVMLQTHLVDLDTCMYVCISIHTRTKLSAIDFPTLARWAALMYVCMYVCMYVFTCVLRSDTIGSPNLCMYVCMYVCNSHCSQNQLWHQNEAQSAL